MSLFRKMFTMTRQDVPVIGVRELILLHLALLASCVVLAWIDWSLPG